MKPTYIVYGNALSYFTRKLEAALDFYQLDYQLRLKTPDLAAEIEQRSGTHQIPVLHTPENWMLADTTPILMLLDGRRPMRRLFPEAELGVLVHILEDYFDEWVARTMVHYRWHYPESAAFAANRMSNGNAEIAERVRAWGPRACRATGTESERQQKAAEAEYLRILQAAEEQLSNTRFLLGDRPCAVDCIVLGGLRAHTMTDPDPKKVTRKFKRVSEWSDSLASHWDGTGELAPFPDSTPFARSLLREMKTTYVPFLLGNKDARSTGAKAFQAHIYAEDVSYLSRPYPEHARQMILERLQFHLTEAQRRNLIPWLQAYGLDTCFSHLI